MQQIPLNRLPSQNMVVNIDGAYWRIALYLSIEGVCADIDRNGVRLISGVRCFEGQPLLPYSYLHAPANGNFIFDYQVDWELFGGQCNLYYLTTDEFDQFKQAQKEGYELVAVKNSLADAKAFQIANEEFNNEYTTIPTAKILKQPDGATFWEYSPLTVNVIAENVILYQWQVSEAATGKAWRSIPNSNTPNLNIAVSRVTDQGYYRCVLSDGVNTISTIPVLINITHVPMPVFTTQPTSKLLVVGQQFQVICAANYADNIKWQKGNSATGPWVDIPGATSTTYTIPVTTLANNGYYRAVATSRYPDPIYSNVARAEIYNMPSVVAQPQNTTYNQNITGVKLTVTAADTVSYSWEQASTADGPWVVPPPSSTGSTTNTFALDPATGVREGFYRCKLTNQVGSVYTNTVKTTMVMQPVIATNPANVGPILTGQNATMSSTATYATTYRWQISSNGTTWADIANTDTRFTGMATTTLTLVSVQPSQPKYYRLKATSVHPTAAYSNTATLAAYDAVVITAQPTSQRMPSNNDQRTFSVVATNAVSYQWQYSNTSATAGWSDVAESTTAIGTKTANLIRKLTGESSVSQQWWRCIVTNQVGSVTSSAATLTYVKDPVFNTQPNSITATAAGAQYSVATTSSNTLTYKWEYRESLNGAAFGSWATLSDSGTVVGATTNNVKITPAATFDGVVVANLRCTITGEFRSVVSDISSVNVYARPVITTQPVNRIGNQNSSLQYSVVAKNSTNYQWQWLNGSTWTNFSENSISVGTKTSTLTRNMAGSGVINGQVLQIRCVVSNQTGSAYQVITNAVTESIYWTPVITAQPQNIAAIASGSNAVFSVAYNNAQNTTISWQASQNGSTWSTIGADPNYSGQGTNTLTCNNVSTTSWPFVRVIISTPYESVTSNSARYTAYNKIVITSQPSNQVGIPNDTHVYQVTANYAVSYSWQVADAAGGPWTDIGESSTNVGVKTNTLTRNLVGQAVGTKWFRCIITNQVGNLASNAVSEITYANITVTTQPSNKDILVGTSASVACAFAGASSYQWQKLVNSAWTNVANGSGISGATTNTITINGAAATTDHYRCVGSNPATSLATNSVAVTIRNAVAITTQPASVAATLNQSKTMTVVATSATSYQWQYLSGSTWANLTNGTNESGVTTATLTIAGRSAAGATQYRCVCSNPVSSLASNAATFTAYANVIINTHPSGPVSLINTSFTMSCVATNATAYQWQTLVGSTWTNVANGSGISGATTNTLVVGNGIATAGSYSYRCVCSNPVNSATTNATVATIRNAVTVTTNPASGSYLQGSTITLSSAFSNALTYQWQRLTTGNWQTVSDGNGISGATTNTLTITNATVAAYNGNQWRCVGSNSVSSATTTAATTTVYAAVAPVISSSTAAQAFVQGYNGAIQVIANPVTGVQWQFSKTPTLESTWGDVAASRITTTYSGQTATTKVDISAFSAERAGYYRCILTGIGGLTTTYQARIQMSYAQYAAIDMTLDSLPSNVSYAGEARRAYVGSTGDILSAGAGECPVEYRRSTGSQYVRAGRSWPENASTGLIVANGKISTSPGTLQPGICIPTGGDMSASMSPNGMTSVLTGSKTETTSYPEDLVIRQRPQNQMGTSGVTYQIGIHFNPIGRNNMLFADSYPDTSSYVDPSFQLAMSINTANTAAAANPVATLVSNGAGSGVTFVASAVPNTKFVRLQGTKEASAGSNIPYEFMYQVRQYDYDRWNDDGSSVAGSGVNQFLLFGNVGTYLTCPIVNATDSAISRAATVMVVTDVPNAATLVINYINSDGTTGTQNVAVQSNGMVTIPKAAHHWGTRFMRSFSFIMKPNEG